MQSLSATPAPAPTPRSLKRVILIASLLATASLAGVAIIKAGSRDGEPPAKSDPVVVAHAQQPDAPQIEAMVGKLAGRLKSGQGSARDWSMLARSYAALGRFREAADAYQELAAMQSPDSGMLTDWADVTVMANGGNFSTESEKLISMALIADANHPKALALAGTMHFKRSDYPVALDYWKRALDLAPEDADFRAMLNGSIEEARTRIKKRTNSH